MGNDNCLVFLPDLSGLFSKMASLTRIHWTEYKFLLTALFFKHFAVIKAPLVPSNATYKIVDLTAGFIEVLEVTRLETPIPTIKNSSVWESPIAPACRSMLN